MKVLLVVYDNDSFIHWFPHGPGYIATVLRDAGHDVTIYSQDVYHWPESHLRSYLTDHPFDVIGVGVIAGYYQYRKLLKISEAIRSAPGRPFYVLGGHGPSPEPGFFMRKTDADAVILGEGEVSVVNLLRALENGDPLAGVKGIAWQDGDEVVVNERQALIRDVDGIPYPAWDLFPMDYYSLLREARMRNDERFFPVLSARGCPFTCNFCYRMDTGVRLRSPESIIDEIRVLRERYQISYVYFADELLMVSEKRAKALSQALIDADLKVRWNCNGRLNFAKPDVLALMKEAGCVFINYGIESMDDEILKVMNKRLTARQVIKGIEATLAAGISPGFNIIFGNIGENRETLQKGVDFLLKYDDHAQLRTIRPVTPYPGSPLYEYAIEKGLLKDIEDFYENKHLNSDLLAVNFTTLSDDEFHEALFDANVTLLKNHSKHALDRAIEEARKLYFERNVDFRGFRQT